MRKALLPLACPLLSLAVLLPAPAAATTAAAAAGKPAKKPAPEIAADLDGRLSRLPRTAIDYDRSLLSPAEKKVMGKLIEAARYLDDIYLRQVAEENPATRRALAEAARTSKPHATALAWFDVMRGRWDRLAHEEPFVAPFGKAGVKPAGAGFYPTDLTKAEMEAWLKANPKDKEAFEGLFTVIRRSGKRLVAIPYSKEYAAFLTPAARKLREAAALSSEPTLKDYLKKRADALLSGDYYASDVAWMDLAGPIDPVFGPYEVYEDSLFNYKAAFESFLTVVDQEESRKLAVYARHLVDMERALPIPDEHKNLSRGSDSPIRVVQQVFSSGEARRGVQTAAFNLPNDEKVREAKGSKKVLLKNVMDAKFRLCGRPIADRTLDSAQLPSVSFAAYFNHTLFHELSHGLGPGLITGPDGKKVDNRILLKDLYSTIEEAKADVVGLWSLLWALEKGLVSGFDEKGLFATSGALMFRGMRFGLNEAHGRGTAVQWGWFREKGAIEPAPGGRFRVVNEKMREAVKSLAAELLMIEATGDYERARKLLETYGKSSPEIEATIARLADIPVDITPVFTGAGETF